MVHSCVETVGELLPLVGIVFALSVGAWVSCVSFYAATRRRTRRAAFYSSLLLVVALGGYLGSYGLLPQYIVVPGRPVWIEGTIVALTSDSVTVHLSTPDPINRVEPGQTFTYAMSEEEPYGLQQGILIRAVVSHGFANIKYFRGCFLNGVPDSWCYVGPG